MGIRDTGEGEGMGARDTGEGVEMEYEYWFAAITALGSRKKHLLREKFRMAKSIFYIEETKLKESGLLNEKDIRSVRQAQKAENLKEQWKRLHKEGVHFIPWFSELFPKKLRDIPDPPYAIYVKGNIPEVDTKAAAIVGARQCTGYGEKYALEFGETLARHKISVISGLARGVDGAAQRGALTGGGLTYAVLGCGVDVCYPREHRGLYADILEKGGGIISEYPPGMQPLPQNFPRRNRIISGLADVVLVLEARERSGSLITADMALEQGKDVYALPGPVSSSLSQGCNQLIRQGAGILLSPEMLLEEMGICPVNDSGNTDKNKKVLETRENMVYSRCGLYPKDLGLICRETELPVNEALECLVTLELMGYIREVSKNHYIKVK